MIIIYYNNYIMILDIMHVFFPPTVTNFLCVGHSPKTRQKMSSAIKSFLLLLSTPLLFNVDVPPFLVSGAIAFSYI